MIEYSKINYGSQPILILDYKKIRLAKYASENNI